METDSPNPSAKGAGQADQTLAIPEAASSAVSPGVGQSPGRARLTTAAGWHIAVQTSLRKMFNGDVIGPTSSSESLQEL